MATSGGWDLTSLQRSIAALRKVLRRDLSDEVIRDAAIKRFEFTNEVAWKMMPRHLICMGRAELEVNRRELFRMAARERLMDDPGPGLPTTRPAASPAMPMMRRTPRKCWPR